MVTVSDRALLVIELLVVETDIDPNVVKYIVVEPVPPVAVNVGVPDIVVDDASVSVREQLV